MYIYCFLERFENCVMLLSSEYIHANLHVGPSCLLGLFGLHGFIKWSCHLLSYSPSSISSGSLRDPFGMRPQSHASCTMHIHPPLDFPLIALTSLYSYINSPIFCPHSFKIAFNLKKVPEKFCQHDKSAYLCTRFPKGKPKRQANGSLTDCEQQTRQGIAEMWSQPSKKSIQDKEKRR